MEMRCFCKLLGISCRDHITNEEVKTRIGNAIWPYEDTLTPSKKHKLKPYGHVTRSSGLVKTVLQGTVQRGRQRKRQEDNIKEWTGFEWNIILQRAESSEEWRKLVVKYAVVPQRSVRLRNRRRDLSSSSSRLCPSTAGCSPPSMSSIVVCLSLSYSRWFPLSLLCHLTIFCLVVLLISSLSLNAALCSVWSTYCPSFLLYDRPISTFVSVFIL